MCSCDEDSPYDDDSNQGLQRNKGFVPKYHMSIVRDNDDTPLMVAFDCEMTEWSVSHSCPPCWGGYNTLNRSLAHTSNINKRI